MTDREFVAVHLTAQQIIHVEKLAVPWFTELTKYLKTQHGVNYHPFEAYYSCYLRHRNAGLSPYEAYLAEYPYE